VFYTIEPQGIKKMRILS